MFMELHIDTTQDHDISLVLKEGGLVVAKNKFAAKYRQAEKLLSAIKKILDKDGHKLTDISRIIVANKGGGFTALRIGIVTANALGYALGVPVVSEIADVKTPKTGKKAKFSVVKPEYDREPNISTPHITHSM